MQRLCWRLRDDEAVCILAGLRFAGWIVTTTNLTFAPPNKSYMDFQFSEEQLMIKQAAKDFAVNECLPGVIERDELQKFPKEQIEKLADLGFMGIMVKPEYGGSGMETISYVLGMEEISKVDASVSVCVSVNKSLVCLGLQEYGTEE